MQFVGFYLGMSRQDGGNQDKSEEGKWIREKAYVFVFIWRQRPLASHTPSQTQSSPNMLLPQRMHIYRVYSRIQELHTLEESLQRNTEAVSDGTRQPHVPFPFKLPAVWPGHWILGSSEYFSSEKQQPVNHSVRKLSVDECQNANWNEKTLSDNLLEILLRVPWPRKWTIAGNYRRGKKRSASRNIE